MTRRRLAALAAVWLLPPAIFVAATAEVYGRYRLAAPPRLGDDARAEAMRVLRAALVGAAGDAPAAPRGPDFDRALPDRGPVIVTAWKDGAPAGRVLGRGDTLGAAFADAAAQLARHPGLRALAPADQAAARLAVDVVGPRGPLGGGDPLFDRVQLPGVSRGLADGLALVPGVDGLAAIPIDADADADRPAAAADAVDAPAAAETFLTPADVIADSLLARPHPVPLLPDLATGFDPVLADKALQHEAGATAGAWHARRRRWVRFRVDSFVERPLASRGDGPPLALERGVPPGPPVTAADLRAAALAGARYLVAHLGPGGRFVYEHDLVSGNRTDPERGRYSIPRHAGATYFLAQVYRVTGAPWLREPIERAAGHLEALVAAGGCAGTTADGAAFACVRDRDERKASLGGAALTVVALVEYERASGDRRFRPLADKLIRFVRWMQRPDGSFTHEYDVAARAKDDDAMELYASGEGALALARMHALTGDPALARDAERALDWLVGWYDFFLGGFFYGEEHWTCIAAEALWPSVDKAAYQDFCDGYGAFLRTQQPAPGDLPGEDDLAGSYNPAAPFAMPSNTPAGSRTEAMISAYQLGVHRGHPDPAIRAQILAALGYLVRQQLRPDSDFDARGGDVDGGMAQSLIDRTVRIDYVQHTGSAMLRAAELLDPPTPAPPTPAPPTPAPPPGTRVDPPSGGAQRLRPPGAP